jgi:hypothetical protein
VDPFKTKAVVISLVAEQSNSSARGVIGSSVANSYAIFSRDAPASSRLVLYKQRPESPVIVSMSGRCLKSGPWHGVSGLVMHNQTTRARSILSEKHSILANQEKIVLRVTDETNENSSVPCGAMLTLVWVHEAPLAHGKARSRRGTREMSPSNASRRALLIAGGALMAIERHICNLRVAVLFSHTTRRSQRMSTISLRSASIQ